MSAEPGRKRAYSTDIRLRIVYQRIGMGLTFNTIARHLNVATSTVHRIFKQFELNGDIVAASPRSHRPEIRLLDERCELIVIGLILESPTLYLHEVCQQIQEITSLSVSQATICRLLQRYGLTRKKVKQVALQRCYMLRGAFMAQCSLFSREQLVWLDETGSNSKDHIRRFGYAIRGTTPVSHRLLIRGKRVNAIAALASDGIIAVDTVVGTVDGQTFFDFLRGTLIPRMRAFNGSNPNSVIIMDNCSIHHIQEVKQLLNQAGILALFLPPYSPDLNPIEEAFNYVKSYLRKHDILLQSGAPMPTIVEAAFESITINQCNSWITDSGYPM